jgi:dolichol-phosphate mannosyltransferase
VAFIFPIYNEASTIDLLHQTVTEVTGALAGRYEFSFIYVDDGSRDQSLETLTALAKEDKRVTAIELSRNFGHQMAVTAGLDLVDADATIIMDSDMQDPPRVALELIEK